MRKRTEQEAFWAGEFGMNYINRNNSNRLLASNLSFFSQALRSATNISSLIEFGANVGMNLRAMMTLFPNIDSHAIEINAQAAKELEGLIGSDRVQCGSILDAKMDESYDVALIKGVLIHLNPKDLSAVYEKLYQASRRYILIAEYYNPQPVSISYRGHENKLFKRDFAGEMLDAFDDLNLIDYGFVYHRDPLFPQDDVTWFLLEKRGKN
jgi:spore coat polysaccharide biosynthesis protein SpsF